jgi:hypothetical protein
MGTWAIVASGISRVLFVRTLFVSTHWWNLGRSRWLILKQPSWVEGVTIALPDFGAILHPFQVCLLCGSLMSDAQRLQMVGAESLPIVLSDGRKHGLVGNFVFPTRFIPHNDISVN